MQGHGANRLATFVDGLVFFLVVVTQVVFYVAATREVHDRWWTRMKYLPFFPIVGVGLAVNNARGVLEALLGHPVAREHVATRAGDVPHSAADGSRLRALFPDVDPVELDTGLAATVDWFRTGVLPAP